MNLNKFNFLTEFDSEVLIENCDCYPLINCWGILRSTLFANIKPYLCECGMEMCIYCYTKCHKACGSYSKEFIALGIEGDPKKIEGLKNFIYEKTKASTNDNIFSCPCHERDHTQPKLYQADKSCNLMKFRAFNSDGTNLCTECGYQVCQFCIKFCHTHTKKNDFDPNGDQ